MLRLLLLPPLPVVVTLGCLGGDAGVAVRRQHSHHPLAAAGGVHAHPAPALAQVAAVTLKDSTKD